MTEPITPELQKFYDIFDGVDQSKVSEFKDFIQVGANLKGDTKEIVCDSTYKSINFDIFCSVNS